MPASPEFEFVPVELSTFEDHCFFPPFGLLFGGRPPNFPYSRILLMNSFLPHFFRRASTLRWASKDITSLIFASVVSDGLFFLPIVVIIINLSVRFMLVFYTASIHSLRKTK